ncbi:WD repeat protein Lub1 [Massospora cicadina]|nr:WD repeat protein Lub1 [Massospora cicadina]
MKFELSKELVGHTQDVKAVAAAFDDRVVLSVSRDTTLRVWNLVDEGETVYLGHRSFVNCVKGIPPTHENPEGLYLTGGSDKVINVFNPHQPEKPTFSLAGHEDNVVTLDTLPDGRILSGSWDRTARVWKGWGQQFVLRGHTQAVWAVKSLSHGLMATGSADRTIRLWDSVTGKGVKVILAHTDCVRGLDELPGKGFVSCGNDGAIKVWGYDGSLLQELFAHTSFVYSVAVLPGTPDCFVSGGEDRSVRIWRGGACVQTITLPAISVWSVAALANGDFVCGTDEGHVRVFTSEPSRKAPPAQIEAFEASVASQAVPSNQVGDISLDQLPDASALLRPGTREGEVRMVRVGAAVEAHQWDSGAQRWQKVGEVVDAVGQGRKQLHEGKEYDYVFDINFTDDAPNLKLPYNVTGKPSPNGLILENPYAAAMSFLQRHELPVSYLDQVAGFITQNTKGETLGPSAAPDPYVDPYTGASRYIAQEPRRANHQLPIREMLTFKLANVEAILAKLTQLNLTLREDVRLNDVELAALRQLPASKAPASKGVDALFKALASWPFGARFPALDLLRILTLSVPWYTTRSLEPLMDLAYLKGAVTKDEDIVIMLSCRLVSNLIAVSQASVRAGLPSVTRFIEKLGQQVERLSPNARTAYFSTLVNLSVMFIMQADAGGDHATQCCLSAMSSLASSLASPPPAPSAAYREANFRALVAVGNLLTACGEEGRALAEISRLVPTLSSITANPLAHEPKAASLAEEIVDPNHPIKLVRSA